MYKGLEYLDPGFWTTTSQIQLGYGVWASLTQVGVGFALGFQTMSISKNVSLDMDVKLSSGDRSWMASVMSLTTPIGCLISGSVTDKYGRRIAILLSQIPMCVGWFFIAFASKPLDIIFGRTMMGIGCGMATFPPRIYAAEISLPNMRGMVGSLADVAVALGITIQILIGQYLSWKTISIVCGTYAIGVFIINNYIPETPYYVLLIGDTTDLQNNLSKFRSSDYNIDEEVDALEDFKQDNNIYRLPVIEKILVLFRRTSCQPLGIITVYFVLAKLSGIDIIVVWALEILTAAHNSVDPQVGNTYLAVSRLVVSTLTSILLYFLGRKPVALISALGVTVVCLSLGSYLHLNMSSNVVPEVFFIMYIVFASLGYYSMPQLMMAELYPLQIRGFMSGVSTSMVYLVSFGILKLYPFVKESLGFANSMFLLGAFSSACTVFLYFFFPETKTLMLQDIEEYYNNLRLTLVSQRSVKLMQLSRSKTADINYSKTMHKHKHPGGSTSNLKLSRTKLHSETSRSKLDNLDESPYNTSTSNSDSVYNTPEDKSKTDTSPTQNKDEDEMRKDVERDETK